MVFRACERFGIIPPGLEDRWENIEGWQQALLLAYSQVREIEEHDSSAHMMKAMFGAK